MNEDLNKKNGLLEKENKRLKQLLAREQFEKKKLEKRLRQSRRDNDRLNEEIRRMNIGR